MLHLAGLDIDLQGRLLGTGAMLLARPRGVNFPTSGYYISTALDSEIFNCTWHRLVLDADIPAETALTVQTFTAPAMLDSEQIKNVSKTRWSIPLTIAPDTLQEVLFQSEPGRYLWLRIGFRSSGKATPRLRSMLVYAPRQSSLHYLPPPFHQDPVSANFLDRYLSYFDTVFQEIESQIERFSGYLDPDGVPSGDFLTWLGSWFDLTFLNEWSDPTRREFIRRAISLYRQRGTVNGIQEILRLHTGLKAPLPMIIEHFRLHEDNYISDVHPDHLVHGKPYLAGLPLSEGIKYEHNFTLVLPSQVVPDETAMEIVRRLVDAQKPAHTGCRIRVVNLGLRIGCQSTIGVDTLLGIYPTAPLGDMHLSQSSMLSSINRSYNQIGQSRLAFGP